MQVRNPQADTFVFHLNIQGEKSSSQSLEEGLCDYMNDEIGATSFCKEPGWDLQEYYS